MNHKPLHPISSQLCIITTDEKLLSDTKISESLRAIDVFCPGHYYELDHRGGYHFIAIGENILPIPSEILELAC